MILNTNVPQKEVFDGRVTNEKPFEMFKGFGQSDFVLTQIKRGER
eukprot:CAMPEP_0182938284 /NCGR_PEP_ID=MMETSP0105_2-20130417/43587_1 /TAXON_ID=81532 ORGANISM="Acanthoeca-like sp., Strain 10tr" /NCGR_SAMPLE_ID=MMETSP0105_2 /ASSEMBLY_ACC=CAM_ASM_000205 /LENGTH=44 /DNA_ID= /DNA_START= /DNA_END= /DNA_ORIENTATION=